MSIPIATSRELDPAFTRALRAILDALSNGREPSIDPTGALAYLLAYSGPTSRLAVERLGDRWFGPIRPRGGADDRGPILNDERVTEPEKLAAIFEYHVVQRRPWTVLSTNESTFYRYRRAAFGEFIDRAWNEISQRQIPTNRPLPDYDRFVGRAAERSEILLRLGASSGGVVGIEGPGGSGKTALAQAIVSLCLEAAREWRGIVVDDSVTVPIFDAVVWVANRQAALGLGDFLDVLARTLDYPGMLGRELADRRPAMRELLARQPVLIVVDDADRADPAVLTFLLDVPGPTRSLVTTRRKLPPRVSAIAPGPLAVDEALELLRAEGTRQSVPCLAIAPETALRPLADSTRRFPLLAVWAAGQLRQGQTVELGTAGYREARVHAAKAVEVLQRAGDPRGVGHAMRLLGRAARERGDFDSAWNLLTEAGALLTVYGRGDDLPIVRASQADLLRRQGRLDEAAARYLEVLGQGLDDPGTRANVLHDLADVRLRQDVLDVAEGLFGQGEAIAVTVGARGLVAECRWGLAQVALRRGDVRRCSVLATEAADLFERLGEAERAAEARKKITAADSSPPPRPNEPESPLSPGLATKWFGDGR